ncbi:DNA topoisomerase (ATP-hydrolyzing) subunit A [Alienimonas sp. DA493]|uniref:DNA gyrase/topoisomerase IV subunit A n=1 Tax=Alienimonas sp. DA493 TaxID=3373605 RepID=UPI003754C390
MAASSPSSNGSAKKKTRRRKKSMRPEGRPEVRYVSLAEETRRRYLNYALSVIGSRALPDARDGLKPVQRRILYVMGRELNLAPGTKTVKCARIVGDTIGKYHPHGDTAAYDTLVRLAQDHAMRVPLVEGQGNFGSVLGLPAAAARYTEARLTAPAASLMAELGKNTVPTRPTYDAERTEPVVFPAAFPHLLVNGATGIAVGMATNIPPHNLREVVNSACHLIDDPDATVAQLMQKGIKGPDFPLGGRIVSDRADIRTAYEEGRGSIKVRAVWDFDPEDSQPKKGRKKAQPARLVIDSLPHGVTSGAVIADLKALAESRKIPQMLEADDETDRTHGLRIVVTVKSKQDAEAVMAYLYKHTALEQNFAVNLTALVPDVFDAGESADHAEAPRGLGVTEAEEDESNEREESETELLDGGEDVPLVPRRLDLKQMLRVFLDFRLQTVTRRLKHDLRVLRRRIHLLEGFEILFSGIDKAIRLIRESDGKADAREKLMDAFPLDELQTNAILEMMLYKISRLEIDTILGELAEKRAEADRLVKLLSDESALWALIRAELKEIGDEFSDRRRTSLGGSEEVEEFDPTAYIVKEDTNVVLTRDGWIKRLGTINAVDALRTREGDETLCVLGASTLDAIVFFAEDGTAYTLPVEQIPASTGYGEPLSKHVKLDDGVRIVAAISTDSRFTPLDFEVDGTPSLAPHLFVATEQGQVSRVGLSGFRDVSTRGGRKFLRLTGDDRVVHVERVDGAESVFLATKKARVLHFKMETVPVLAGPGKGVKGIDLEKSDAVLGAQLCRRPSDVLHVLNVNDKELPFGQMKYTPTGRGGKGVKTSQRTGFKQVLHDGPDLVDWGAAK